MVAGIPACAAGGLWVFTLLKALLPSSFVPWWALCKCRLGLRLSTHKGFSSGLNSISDFQKVVHIFFRDCLSWVFSFLTGRFSPMDTEALWLGYLMSKKRGFLIPPGLAMDWGADLGWNSPGWWAVEWVEVQAKLSMGDHHGIV